MLECLVVAAKRIIDGEGTGLQDDVMHDITHRVLHGEEDKNSDLICSPILQLEAIMQCKDAVEAIVAVMQMKIR